MIKLFGPHVGSRIYALYKRDEHSVRYSLQRAKHNIRAIRRRIDTPFLCGLYHSYRFCMPTSTPAPAQLHANKLNANLIGHGYPRSKIPLGDLSTNSIRTSLNSHLFIY